MQYFLRRKTSLEENSEKSDGTHKNTEGFLLTVQPCMQKGEQTQIQKILFLHGTKCNKRCMVQYRVRVNE